MVVDSAVQVTGSVIAAPRTRLFAVGSVFILWFIAGLDIFLRSIWHESLILWFTGLVIALSVAWLGLLSNRVWAWRVLTAIYGVLFLVSTVKIRQAMAAVSSEYDEPIGLILAAGVLVAVFIVLPLLLLVSDSPRHWRETGTEGPDKRSRSLNRQASLLLLSFFVLTGFWMSQNPPGRRAQEDDIREAVLRYQFSNNGSRIQDKDGAYYIEVCYYPESQEGFRQIVEKAKCLMYMASIEPSAEFLARFKGNTPPVKPRSACNPDVQGVVDKQSNKRGIILSVGSIKWIDDNLVEVAGGYYEDGLSASASSYRLARKHGHWVIIRERLIWIS